MATVALFDRRDVRRMLAGRGRPIMAGRTAAQDLQVIHGVGRCPDDIVVAVFTDVGGLNVGRALAGGLDAIVTIDAVAGNVGVIEVGRYPRRGGMAVATDVTAADV